MFRKTISAAIFGVICAGASLAAPLKLTPADPQPSGLQPGLSVRYAYPMDVKNLRGAARALERKSRSVGPPLDGA